MRPTFVFLLLVTTGMTTSLTAGTSATHASECGDKIRKAMKPFERTHIYRKELGAIENLCTEANASGNQGFAECVSQLAEDIGASLVRPTGIIQICSERSDLEEIEKTYRDCREQQGKPPETLGLVAKKQLQEICLLEAQRAQRREALEASKPNRTEAAGTPPVSKNRPGHLNSDLKGKVIRPEDIPSSTGMEIIRNTGEDKPREE